MQADKVIAVNTQTLMNVQAAPPHRDVSNPAYDDPHNSTAMQKLAEALAAAHDAPVVYNIHAVRMASFACILFIVIGVFGNLVTIVALAKSKKLIQNATTIFVMNLCVAYLLFCTISLPFTASRFIYQSWVLGDTLCNLYPFFFYSNFAASLMSMVAITINRYVLIVHNSIYDKVYTKVGITMWLVFTWVFSFCMLMPPLLGIWGEFGYKPKTFSCTILSKHGTSPKKFLFIFGFGMPCAVIIISYLVIYFFVRRNKRKLHLNQSQRRHREEMKLTRMMLIIFCAFVMCQLPLTIMNVAVEETTLPTLHIMASIFAWMSSVVNPFIYAVMNKTYRRAYFALLPTTVKNFCFTLKQGTCPNSNVTSSHGTPRQLGHLRRFCSVEGAALMGVNGVLNDSGVGSVSRTPSPHSRHNTNDRFPSFSNPLKNRSQANGNAPTNNNHANDNAHANNKTVNRNPSTNENFANMNVPTNNNHVNGDAPVNDNHINRDKPTNNNHINSDIPINDNHINGDTPTNNKHPNMNAPNNNNHVNSIKADAPLKKNATSAAVVQSANKENGALRDHESEENDVIKVVVSCNFNELRETDIV